MGNIPSSPEASSATPSQTIPLTDHDATNAYCLMHNGDWVNGQCQHSAIKRYFNTPVTWNAKELDAEDSVLYVLYFLSFFVLGAGLAWLVWPLILRRRPSTRGRSVAV